MKSPIVSVSSEVFELNLLPLADNFRLWCCFSVFLFWVFWGLFWLVEVFFFSLLACLLQWKTQANQSGNWDPGISLPRTAVLYGYPIIWTVLCPSLRRCSNLWISLSFTGRVVMATAAWAWICRGQCKSHQCFSAAGIAACLGATRTLLSAAMSFPLCSLQHSCLTAFL